MHKIDATGQLCAMGLFDCVDIANQMQMQVGIIVEGPQGSGQGYLTLLPGVEERLASVMTDRITGRF